MKKELYWSFCNSHIQLSQDSVVGLLIKHTEPQSSREVSVTDMQTSGGGALLFQPNEKRHFLIDIPL